jgi:prepilin peptidase CpaA
MQIQTTVILAVVLVAAVIDVRTHRIPNLLTFGSAAAALPYHAWMGGLAGLGASAGGWMIGVGLFLPLFLLRGMGGGDVKLLGAVGAWLGPTSVLYAGLYSVLAGGVLALVIGGMHGYLGKAFSNLWGLLGFWRTAGIQPLPGMTIEDSPGPRLAYGVAIAAGTFATVWLKK